MVLGTLCGARWANANSRNSCTETVAESRTTTAAATSSPSVGCGTLNATASSTPGWRISTSSISAGDTFIPPRLMSSLIRPVMNRYPSVVELTAVAGPEPAFVERAAIRVRIVLVSAHRAGPSHDDLAGDVRLRRTFRRRRRWRCRGPPRHRPTRAFAAPAAMDSARSCRSRSSRSLGQSATPNAASRRRCCSGGSAKLLDRMKRNVGGIAFRCATRSRSDSSSAGFAAKYVIARCRSASSSACASAPSAKPIAAPAASGESSECAKAPAVKFGATNRQRSALSIGCARERARSCACVSGTAFGFDVVPDVWKTIARSSGDGAVCGTAGCAFSTCSMIVPAGAVCRRCETQQREAERARNGNCRWIDAFRHDQRVCTKGPQQRLALRSAQSRIERNADPRTEDRYDQRGRFGSIRQRHRDAASPFDTGGSERGGRPFDLRQKRRVAERSSIRSDDRRRRAESVGLPDEELVDRARNRDAHRRSCPEPAPTVAAMQGGATGLSAAVMARP